MKRILLTLFIILTSIFLYAQFSNDLGVSSSFSETKKTIYHYGPPYWDGHYCNPPALPKKRKVDRSNRRYKFRAHLYDNCSYKEDDLNSTNGWNKVGRISFVEVVNANLFKMHLGWLFRDDPNIIRFSLFFHNNTSEAFVAHVIDERTFTDANLSVDMYLGRTVIGMIINNEYDPNYNVKCIGIKEDNSDISVSKDSYVSKTFYFGGKSRAPHDMEMKFHDQRVDDAGY